MFIYIQICEFAFCNAIAMDTAFDIVLLAIVFFCFGILCVHSESIILKLQLYNIKENRGLEV